MRPSYQKYHEVRGELDVLQSSIEKKYGLIPLFTEESLDPDKIAAINSTSISSRTAGEGTGSGTGTGGIMGTGTGSGSGAAARSIRSGDTLNSMVVTPYLAPSPAEFLTLGAPNRGPGVAQTQGPGPGQGGVGTGTGSGGGGELFSSCLFKGTGTGPQSNGPVPTTGR